MQTNITLPNISNNVGTILRDVKGRLLPGQKLYKLRKHEGGGRKPGIKRQIQKVFEDLLPDCEAQVAQLAFNAENERVRLDACVYIRDCLKGKPHQSQDLRIGKLTPFSGDDYELAMRQVRLEDRKLIEQYSKGGINNAIQGYGEAEGSFKAINGEEEAEGEGNIRG